MWSLGRKLIFFLLTQKCCGLSKKIIFSFYDYTNKRRGVLIIILLLLME
jgi:hypothetical protein